MKVILIIKIQKVNIVQKSHHNQNKMKLKIVNRFLKRVAFL